MTNPLTPVPLIRTLPALSLQDKLKRYAELGLQGSDNTRRAYKSDVAQFQAWCQAKSYAWLPCESMTLCEYFTECIETKVMKWATLQRALNALRKYHKLAGKPFPDDELLKAVLEGIKREIGVRQKKAPAFRAEEFGRLLDNFVESDAVQLRDKALLLTGLTGAFRRSELVAIEVEHIRHVEEGIIIEIPRSKTNQHGEAEHKALFYNPNPARCPVRALTEWIATLERTTGPVFISFRRGAAPGEVRYTSRRLSDKSVGLILKHYMGSKYSAHSLRASFVTIAKRNGADDSSIQRQTGHKSSAMIERYTRLDSIIEHNAASTLTL